MSKAREKRCPWCLGSELYIDYHDNEWGVPCYDAQTLFELINLEGAQAGLSWITILNKRENYRRAFAGFDPNKLVRFSEKKIDKLVTDPGIVRHRGKVAAVVSNAQAYLDMAEQGEDFADFLWAFVDYKPVQNRLQSMSDAAASTDVSQQMSKALKKRGFKFVGGTIAYAFMQAAGMVNDHLVSCPGHKAVKAQAKQLKRPAHWP